MGVSKLTSHLGDAESVTADYGQENSGSLIWRTVGSPPRPSTALLRGSGRDSPFWLVSVQPVDPPASRRAPCPPARWGGG
eukprot:7875386-Pyramimonas_sp.AAC.2